MVNRLRQGVRVLFMGTQLFCALYVTKQAIDSWEESPIVTSVREEPITEVPFPSITICPPSTGKWKAIARAWTKYDDRDNVMYYGDWSDEYEDAVKLINMFSKFAMSRAVSSNSAMWLVYSGMQLTEAEADVANMVMYNVHRFETAAEAEAYLSGVVIWAILEADKHGGEATLTRMRSGLKCWLGLANNADCSSLEPLSEFEEGFKLYHEGAFEIVQTRFTNTSEAQFNVTLSMATTFSDPKFLPGFCTDIADVPSLAVWCQYLFLGSKVVSGYNFKNYIASLKVIFSYGINMKQAMADLVVHGLTTEYLETAEFGDANIHKLLYDYYGDEVEEDNIEGKVGDFFLQEAWNFLNPADNPDEIVETYVTGRADQSWYTDVYNHIVEMYTGGDDPKNATKKLIKANEERLLMLTTSFFRQPKAHFDPESNATQYPFIPFCMFHGDGMAPCNLFKEAETTGMEYNCYTFNGDLAKAPNGTRIGSDRGLHLLLEDRFAITKSERKEGFRITVHKPGTIPDFKSIRQSFLTAPRGQAVSIGVKATVTDTTSSFDDMSFEKRGCRSNLDVDATGEKYSQVKCLVTTKIQRATATCECLPWHLVESNRKSKLPLCDLYGMNCFKEIIEDEKSDDRLLTNGSCPKECTGTFYSLTVSDQHDIKTMPNGVPEIYVYTGIRNRTAITAGASGSGSGVNPFLMTIKVGSTFAEIRKERLADMAVVRINFGDPQATFITKDAKVTFADMLGNIGGTFGIFLGLSFISLLDYILDFYDSAIKPQIKKSVHFT